MKYNATLGITDAIRGTSKEKLYRESNLESFQQRRCYKTFAIFSTFLKTNVQGICLIQFPNQTVTIKPEIAKVFHNFESKIFFFPSSISEWNKLDKIICNSDKISTFKTKILKFVVPVPKSIFKINESRYKRFRVT